MLVKQLSVFVENKVGSVSDVADLLGKNGINIRSLQVADSQDFGILRLIVDDAHKALEIIKENGFTAKLTDVVSVIVPDKPNGLSELLNVLKENNIALDYLYVFLGKNNLGAQAIIKTDDTEKLESILLNQFY